MDSNIGADTNVAAASQPRRRPDADENAGPQRGRLLLVGPVAAPGLAALALIAMSPFAWGAGDHVGVDSWIPTGSGLAVAMPVLLVSAKTTMMAWRRLSVPSKVDLFSVWYLPVSLIAMVVLTALVLGMTSSLGAAGTYNRLADDGDNVAFAGNIFIYTLIGGCVAAAIAGGSAIFYSNAFVPSGPSRFDRQPGDPDPMGELLGHPVDDQRP